MPGSDLSHNDGGAVPPPVDPWDRRETEPEQAYARFREYLSLGAGRTLDGLADRLAEPKYFLDQLRRAWDWTRRAEAYDQAVANSLARGGPPPAHRAPGRPQSA